MLQTQEMKDELSRLSDDALKTRCVEIWRFYLKDRNDSLNWAWFQAGRTECYDRDLKTVWLDAETAAKAELAKARAANQQSIAALGKPRLPL